MRVLVLGSRGQLGSDIVKTLQFHSIEVIQVDRTILDAASSDIADRLAALPDVNYIINCMAYVNVDGAETSCELAMQVNASFPYALARHAERIGAILVHISTDFVFGGDLGRSYTEIDQMTPVNFYGLSKAAGESAVRGSSKRNFIIRVSGLYGISGSGSKGGNFVETMIKKGTETGLLKVVDDQFTTPTHTADVARVILTLILDRVEDFGTYHCAAVNKCSWFSFASEIIALAGVKAAVEPIELASLKMLAPRPVDSSLNTVKLQRFIELPTWESALHDYFKIRNHRSQA